MACYLDTLIMSDQQLVVPTEIAISSSLLKCSSIIHLISCTLITYVRCVLIRRVVNVHTYIRSVANNAKWHSGVALCTDACKSFVETMHGFLEYSAEQQMSK